MPKVAETMERFRKWVEGVEHASSDGLHVICDPVFIRRLYDDLDRGVSCAISISLGAVIDAQKERDRAIIEAAHRREVAELHAALGKIYKCVDNKRGVDVSLLVKGIIADALGMVAERDAPGPIAALLDSDLLESER